MALHIQNLSYRYAGAAKPALNGLNLRLSPGECAFIGGANGAGKSTLVSIIAGIIPAFSGGELAGETGAGGARPGCVLQNIDSQLLNETAAQELAFFAKYAGRAGAGPEEAARSFGVERLLERKTAALSSGEKQRIVLAGALQCSGGRLMVLDEPASCLDADATQKLCGAIETLKVRSTAVLLTGHRAGNFARVLDSRYEMRGGNLYPVGMADPPQTPDVYPPAANLPDCAARARDIILKNQAGETILPPARFEIKKGEIAGLYGPNGSGKSSFAKILAGWSAPDGGTVELAGKKAGTPLLRRKTRLLGNNPFSGLIYATVRENLDYARRISLKPGFDCAAAGQILSITSLIGRDVSSLSFGQAQRAALLCALAYSPELLILDEATACLDAEGFSQFGKLLRGFAAEGGAALVISHIENHLRPLCSRVVSLSELYA